MVEANSPDSHGGRKSGWLFAGVTLLVLGLTSSTVQMLAWVVADLPVTVGWSTGGLVAIAAAVAMGLWCRRWETWWRWIWVPIIVVAVLATWVSSAAIEEYRVAEREAQCTALEHQLGVLESQREELLLGKSSQNRGSEGARWPLPTEAAEDNPVDWGAALEAVERSHERQRYHEANGGSEIEAELRDLEGEIGAARTKINEAC